MRGLGVAKGAAHALGAVIGGLPPRMVHEGAQAAKLLRVHPRLYPPQGRIGSVGGVIPPVLIACPGVYTRARRTLPRAPDRVPVVTRQWLIQNNERSR